MKGREREAAGVSARARRGAREGEIHGVPGKLIESKSSRANLPGTPPNRSPFVPPTYLPVTMLVSSYHVRILVERNFFDLFSVTGRVRRTFARMRLMAVKMGWRQGAIASTILFFFFVSRVSRSGDMREVRQNDFGDDNASGRVILDRVRGSEIFDRNLPFSTNWKPLSLPPISRISRSYIFKRSRWMRVSPSWLSGISKSIRNA